MEMACSPQPGSSAAAGGSPEGVQDEESMGSPPIDERSLHESLAKNREKLQLKLLTRRPIHQLVQQGIIPREYIGQYLVPKRNRRMQSAVCPSHQESPVGSPSRVIRRVLLP